jgi:hypothetical protein
MPKRQVQDEFNLFNYDSFDEDGLPALVGKLPEKDEDKRVLFRIVSSVWAIQWDLPQAEYLRRLACLEKVFWPPRPEPITETSKSKEESKIMAVLTPPPSTGPFGELPIAPTGTFNAKCIEIDDQFGVERKKYQSEEMQKLDVTRFLFGFRDAQGQPHKVATKEMRITGHENSSLYKFLMGWLGTPPKMGWDFCEMKGQDAMITVGLSENGNYNTIINISPMPTQAAAPAAAPVQDQAPAPAAPPALDADDDSLPF